MSIKYARFVLLTWHHREAYLNLSNHDARVDNISVRPNIHGLCITLFQTV